MLDPSKLPLQISRIINTSIRIAKSRRREQIAIGVAASLFVVSFYFDKWLPTVLHDFIASWYGHVILPGAFFTAGLIILGYGIYRIWKLTYVPDLPPPANRPSAIKGPLAFTPSDGELFRKLGREVELRKLLGYVKDDQVRMVVFMGASGAGKTSLLRAGLTDILKDTSIQYHYWEAVSADSGNGLLNALRQNWNISANAETHGLQSLDELINPAPELGTHVIVLDQFEQLGLAIDGPVFGLLRRLLAKPGHRTASPG